MKEEEGSTGEGIAMWGGAGSGFSHRIPVAARGEACYHKAIQYGNEKKKYKGTQRSAWGTGS